MLCLQYVLVITHKQTIHQDQMSDDIENFQEGASGETSSER